MGTSENIIELKGIRKIYEDNFEAVKDFNLQVKKGEFVTFLGPSGCGKTTTLRMIAGFDIPTYGQILLNGKDISQLPPNKRPINTVFQRYALFPHLNIYDNIAFGLKLKTKTVTYQNAAGETLTRQEKLSRGEIRDKVRHALEIVDLEGFEKRSIPIPDNEFIIRGSQEGFIEAIRTNTSLLRRLINSENLIIETTSVGKINNNTCCICYLKNIANPSLISEVKYRVNNVEVDSIISSGELEQLITDSKFGLPLVIATERPDRVASYLLDGRVAIIINGSPYVLVAPSVLTDFLSSSEDKNLNSYFSNLLKFVRLLALIITLSLPGFYIAVTTFHQEIIPTELLFAIVSSRNSVPFPIIFEILIMEISLELIRESGIYVPSPLGQTIGIVGGLILGDAAVSAHIVSPILIIVVAITGLTSFAVPDYSLSFHIRIVRFAYILAGYFAGFLGIALAITIHLAALSSINSFGVCYLNPYTFFGVHKSNSYFLNPIWKRENREPFLKTKRAQREPKISMKWKFGGKN